MNQSSESKDLKEPEKAERERLATRIHRASKKELNECVDKIDRLLDSTFERHTDLIQEPAK